MHCLWCEQTIMPEVSWSNFLLPDKPAVLCETCEAALERLADGKARCQKCSKESKKTICTDCEKWENDPNWSGILRYNCSVFSYNPVMQDMIAKWKYRGDYALVTGFESAFQQTFHANFHKVTNPTLVPIPLSAERLAERGFNQAIELALLLDVSVKELLTRIHGEKQSKKTRRERISSANPFQVTDQMHTPVILIDDIYTTGTTLRHAAKKLKEQGCPAVYSLTLIRG